MENSEWRQNLRAEVAEKERNIMEKKGVIKNPGTRIEMQIQRIKHKGVTVYVYSMVSYAWRIPLFKDKHETSKLKKYMAFLSFSASVTIFYLFYLTLFTRLAFPLAPFLARYQPTRFERSSCQYGNPTDELWTRLGHLASSLDQFLGKVESGMGVDKYWKNSIGKNRWQKPFAVWQGFSGILWEIVMR